MRRDIYIRTLFIPLLGILLPVLSGLMSYHEQNTAWLIAAHFFFILTSFTIWAGCHWIHKRLRPLFPAESNPFLKIITICSVSSLYGAATGGFAFILWEKLRNTDFPDGALTRFIALCVIAVVVFTLIYEILYLSKEREKASRLMNEMGRELSHAELALLTNQLDPHFVFNSLNAMNHLILNNPMQAHLFNNNLALVFKYFLKNKTRELIPLQDEISFINSYFFLLEIRYEKKLQLNFSLGENAASIMIPPCALQILVENAIKHNEFTNEHPLLINIAMNGHYLKVSNKTRPKPYAANSTNIGLKNLSSRFKLICRKDIMIEKTKESFTVKLPIIKYL
ncbi:MAG: histidine kinase [Chitinophagaceae bacterium]|nr:histidine kinase [Chitinophagaceae bacterium]